MRISDRNKTQTWNRKGNYARLRPMRVEDADVTRKTSGTNTNAKTNVFAQVPTPKMMNKVALAA
jgi:hypothetical protein